YRPIFRQLKARKEKRIVLDCNVDKIGEILKQAQQVGMLTEEQSYVITSLDFHSLNLDDFKYGRTNITAFRLVDVSNKRVLETVNEWMRGELQRGVDLGFAPRNLRTETALMYDAVHLLARGLTQLDHGRLVTIKPLDCDLTDTWIDGHSLYNYMKMVELDGLSGNIKFDTRGFRSEFELQVLDLVETGVRKVGTWSKGSGLFLDVRQSVNEKRRPTLFNKTIVVSTILSDPYTMYKESSHKLEGNDQFEGFCVDLVEEMSKKLKFNYTIKLADDGVYGSSIRDADGNIVGWDGIIAEVISGVADIGIGDLTINTDRSQGVDFTTPWMNTGISILFIAPTKQPPSLFSFLSPLSLDVWFYMSAAYVFASLILFALARFTPYEWVNPYPCIEEPDELENELTLSNCLWHNWGSLMQQGSDIAPKAVSTRMVAGMWWFFTLIMISSYTANLAAFLTVERLVSPISSAEDLAKQTKIKYGALLGGSTARFFLESKYGPYQKMGDFMKKNKKQVMVPSNQEGVEKVLESNGGYAYFMERQV
ncbi:unnamed protein product, partial [Cyprideis torosa]